jgi:hypothetical protein
MMRRNRSVLLAMMLTGVLTSTAVAQKPGGRAAVLRGRIEEQFVRRMQNELGLSDDNAARMQRVVVTWATRRRALEEDERRLRQALNQQLRPGVAANSDSVGTYVDELTANRVAYAQSFRDEMRDLTPILTPVQRGQFQILRDRLLMRMQEVQQPRQAAP